MLRCLHRPSSRPVTSVTTLHPTAVVCASTTHLGDEEPVAARARIVVCLGLLVVVHVLDFHLVVHGLSHVGCAAGALHLQQSLHSMRYLRFHNSGEATGYVDHCLARLARVLVVEVWDCTDGWRSMAQRSNRRYVMLSTSLLWRWSNSGSWSDALQSRADRLVWPLRQA